MDTIHFTPGPSQLYPGTDQFIQEALRKQVPSISHRSAAFKSIFKGTVSALRELMNVPEDYHILFFSSATEIWERLLQAFHGPGFFFVNGNFSERFRAFAREMGRLESSVEAPLGQGFPMERVHIPDGTGLVGMIGNETSTGVMTPANDYYLIADRFPQPLHFIDLTSASPIYQVDFRRVDGAYFSVQKGFGLPAGLGVLVLSDRALERVKEATGNGEFRGNHRSLVEMARRAEKHQTPETPNVLGIFLLGKVARAMLDRGDELFTTSKLKADRLYQFFDAHPRWQPTVDTPRWRSETVVVLDTPNQAGNIATALARQGFVVGQGYSERKDDQIRIANFPATSLEQTEMLVEAFQKLEIPV